MNMDDIMFYLQLTEILCFMMSMTVSVCNLNTFESLKKQTQDTHTQTHTGTHVILGNIEYVNLNAFESLKNQL